MSNQRPKLQRIDLLVKQYNFSILFVLMKHFIFKTNKIITYYIVNLMNLRNTPIQVRKVLYTLQGVVVKRENQDLNFKEKLIEVLSVFFHTFKLKQ